MWRILLIAVLGLLALACPNNLLADNGWLTDYDEAIALSKESGKPVLANFTGSDWCIWCQRLHGEVFSKKEFKDFASQNLILLELDFPRKSISDELKAQNDRLAKRYKVQGFPTILILDADGSVIEKTGYRRGGAAPYVEHLRSIIK